MLVDFLERERGREGRGVGREREGQQLRHPCVRNIHWLPLILAPTRDATHNLCMCPDRDQTPTFCVCSWDDIQPTEPPNQSQK